MRLSRHVSPARPKSASRFVDEGVAGLVGHAGQVELEGEALLEAVAALDVDGVDAVERLLGRPDDRRALGRDLRGDLAGGGRAARPAGTTCEHRAVVVQLGRGRRGRRVDHRPHLVLGHEPGQVGGGAERAAVDLGQAEGGVVGGDDDVGVADQADAAAEAEAVDGGDDRHRALVDGGEGGVAAPVGADQGVEALGGLHLLDVDAGVEAAALGRAGSRPAPRGRRPRRARRRRPARTSRPPSAR